ncbi:DUF4245 family protein [Microbacterium betulae]|uniref:DUF4245 family protein n=1 Tax=Microbacterium betulae TaxID=2981139 RepID=A0AA97FJF6_9MICO|nr:DUF4245 family protein [Microbacterium sp. AB]WOF24383.1 DUF4245 family protein [Microbacterium sp. AB]
MAHEPRVVAHLGRPETPEEAAARKAESSRNYRGSQTFRNLLTALFVSLVVVVVIVWGVPRGETPERPEIDVAGVAANAEESIGRDVVVPDAPESWRVNDARIEAGAPESWKITYAPEDAGFIVLSQAFDADGTWAARSLGGAAPTGSVTIDGIVWDVYEFSDPAANANISYALGTQAGADHVLVYGSTTPELAADAASLVSDQLRALDADASEGTSE